jgi:hypothetical protein
MLNKISTVLIAAVILSGCTTVNHVPLTISASKDLIGKTIIATHYEKADFSAFTAGKAAFAIVGAAAMIAEGNKIVTENKIPDPAIAITATLLEKMQLSRAIKIQTSTNISSKDDIPSLISGYPGAEYLLDVKTFNWMFNYYPSDWSHYKVTYSARMRLINTSSKKVISETMCSTVQGDDNNPPTKEDLLKDEASLLKDYLKKASSACVEVLATQVLMLKS